MNTSYQPKLFDQDKFVNDLVQFKQRWNFKWDALAEACGTSIRTLYKYKDKAAYPKTDVFLNLCSMMGKDAMAYLKVPSQIGSQVQK